MSKLSMRKVAKELGISPAYLSYMATGKGHGGRICTSVIWRLLSLLLTVMGILLTLRPPTTEAGMVAPTGFEPVT